MNKLSLVLNAVLLVAVGVLFYLYTSLNNRISGTAGTSDSTAVKTPKLVLDPTKLTDAKIAYINIDTLNEQYEYISDKTKEITTKQANLEAQYNGMIQKFQADYEALQQAAQAGIRSEAELQQESAKLQKRQMDIAAKEKQLQTLADETAEGQINMRANLAKFVEKFNNGKYDYIMVYSSGVSPVLYARPDLDLTSEIVKGLNEEYRSTKAAKPATKK
jgi:outer membrane protein